MTATEITPGVHPANPLFLDDLYPAMLSDFLVIPTLETSELIGWHTYRPQVCVRHNHPENRMPCRFLHGMHELQNYLDNHINTLVDPFALRMIEDFVASFVAWLRTYAREPQSPSKFVPGEEVWVTSSPDARYSDRPTDWLQDLDTVTTIYPGLLRLLNITVRPIFRVTYTVEGVSAGSSIAAGKRVWS